MNLYFVLEGEKTEMLLYPKWINYIIPQLTQVDQESDVLANNFYIFSGGGIPSIYNHTVNAIKNINDNPIFDRLIVCLDGEEIGVDARVDEIKNYIEKSDVKLNDKCKIDFVIQNVCIETWFLGNRKVIKRNPAGDKLGEYKRHYNVINEDPELMEKMENFRNKAHFHISYFKEALKEHDLSYSKSNPKIVTEKSYLDELIKRVNDTTHLSSLKNLIIILMEIKLNFS
ncbi:MAG: hypothetical protein LBV72_02390 [Tannerella sp.]|jgi:hypothetical protein|nr:hypothetical protein [Tannerella sp.]